jgi:hypothetical protein
MTLINIISNKKIVWKLRQKKVMVDIYSATGNFSSARHCYKFTRGNWIYQAVTVTKNTNFVHNI